MEYIKVGITIGDINGIGPEIIIKAFKDKRLLKYCIPIIYASTKVISYHLKNTSAKLSYKGIQAASEAEARTVNVLNCWKEDVDINLGQITENGGKCAIQSIESAMRDYKNGDIDAIVTAPINKFAMSKVGYKYPGHTEYFAAQYLDQQSLMMMVSDDLRVGLVTNHLPLDEIVRSINMELIIKKIKAMHQSLVKDFGIDNPMIAVLGLNPHAGEQGKLGMEEEIHIVPAINKCKNEGILAMGPYPADGFFGTAQYKKFDAVLAMYHDQGLIPFKSLTFGQGVNFTAGLSLVRTSPDHGTGFDIAGKDEANPSSFRHALYNAVDIVRARREYEDARKNQLKRSEQTSNNRRNR